MLNAGLFSESGANDVFRHPWEWLEIPWEKAQLQCVFMPVVMVTNRGGMRQADYLTLHWSPDNMLWMVEAPRFYTQVGTGKAATATGPVAHPMDISKDALDFIGKGYENPHEKGWNPKLQRYFPYDDGLGYMTIGYGHKVKPREDFTKGLTVDQVQELLRTDLDYFVKGVNRQLTVGVSQAQFDALVDLVFNVGVDQKAPGWTIKHHVTRPAKPIRTLNAGKAVKETDFTDYAKSHDKHKHGKPVLLKGLVVRRKAEWKMFKDGVYDATH